MSKIDIMPDLEDIPAFPSDGPYVMLPERTEPVVPAPPKPARVRMAHVERTYSRIDVTYVITGSRAGVLAEIECVKNEYPSGLYSTSFAAPVEIEPGVWQARGRHSRSCD